MTEPAAENRSYVKSKAILLVVPEEHAEVLARLIASLLSMNGYSHNQPAVIDWPVR
jgi:hypothetical protein